MEAHLNTRHGGTAKTLVYLRKTHWILTGRYAVKRALKFCQICRCYEVRSLLYPGPTNLPSNIINLGTPFEVTGVDYTGALTITGDDGPQRKYKSVFFTCASTRATVHILIVLKI